MDLLLLITIGFIIIGVVVLVPMKNSMESKIALIKANRDNKESSKMAKSVIWWIQSVTAWGIVSMILIVWTFHHYIG